MTLRQLRAFQQIVGSGSFHAATEDLKLSQPSVSQRSRELESALRTPLFVRRGPRLSLTAEGHALIASDRAAAGTSQCHGIEVVLGYGRNPRRISICNIFSATAAAIVQGAAIGIVPVRFMEDAVSEGRVRGIKGSPPVPAHRVAIGYQIREFGTGLRILVDVIRELARDHKLFA